MDEHNWTNCTVNASTPPKPGTLRSVAWRFYCLHRGATVAHGRIVSVQQTLVPLRPTHGPNECTWIRCKNLKVRPNSAFGGWATPWCHAGAKHGMSVQAESAMIAAAET